MKLTRAKYDFLKEIIESGPVGAMLLSYIRSPIARSDLASLERAGYMTRGPGSEGVMITDTGRARLDIGPPSALLDGVLRAEISAVRAAFNAGFTSGAARQRGGAGPASVEFDDWFASLD